MNGLIAKRCAREQGLEFKGDEEGYEPESEQDEYHSGQEEQEGEISVSARLGHLKIH